MLPSTGYFKAINCPFYDNGTCERPYCHFRHSKREDAGVAVEAAETVENRSTDQVEGSKTNAIVASSSDVLQQLVTEAVQKVLATRTVSEIDNLSCENVVSQVVEGLKPTLTPGSSTLNNISANTGEKRTEPLTVNKPPPCVYNPTPIAELKKRHIPIVSYMPTRESRVAVKRKCSPDGIKPWLSVGAESSESQNVEVKYKPTVIVNSETRDSIQSYIPTSKSDSCSSNSNSCKDGSSNDYLFKLKEAYYPRSKKRREEYVPKKVKAPLKTTGELNGSPLDQIEADYDMMDEALTCTRTTCDVPPSEVSQDSYTDIEPKFSDDEEDDSNNQAKSEEKSEKINEISIASTDRITSFVQKESHRYFEQFKSSNDLQGMECINDRYNKKPSMSNKIQKSEEPVNVLSQCDIDKKVSEENVEKDAVKDIKEHKSARKDKTEKKNQKDHSSSHKKYKDKHESSERSRSTSHSKSKDKSKDRNHSRHESSKEAKDKKYDKDKRRSKDHDKSRERDRDKEKNESRQKSKSDKKDHHKSDKRHEHSKNDKSRKDKSSDHSRINRKSDDKYVERRNVRNSMEKSSNSLDNVGLNSINDDDDVNDNCYSSIIDDALFSASDSDHDVEEECLKIFQEYQVPKRLKSTETPLRENEDEKQKEQNEEIGKKRVAHASAAGCMRPIGLAPQVKKSVNPHQKMYERWRLMRDVAEKTTCSSISVPKDTRRNHTETVGSNDIKLNGNGRIRIAHVPYAKSLTIEKRKVTENAGKVTEAKPVDNCKTAAQTTKSGVRVAHVPQVIPQLMRPEPLQVATQKFPLNVRQYYLNMMHDVCVLIYTNAEDAAQRATKEEYACHERCKALAVYKNSCMLAAHRLRKEVEQSSSIENNTATMPSSSSIVSHEAVLAGKSKGSWSVLRTKRVVTEFKGTALYNMLKKWILTEQQLRDNGFPRPHPDGQKGRAKVYVINSRNQSVLSKVPNERICCRCGQSYMVDKQGNAVQFENCIYHWGRKFTIRGESKYSCCQQYGSASGCCDARTHVWDYVDYENLRGYVKTFPKNTPIEEQGVYALDCEMCYTTQGLELTRITVIDEDCSVAYETLVKPQNTIIDYNTRFSGITEESMKNTTTSLLEVQATLLTMFSEKTILVGHSLESDLKALRLLHDTVVDTSVMFPHKNGYPQKRALKNLCSEYLRKIIQNDVGGHDSKEDAIACMELILWKAKEEAKLQ